MWLHVFTHVYVSMFDEEKLESRNDGAIRVGKRGH